MARIGQQTRVKSGRGNVKGVPVSLTLTATASGQTAVNLAWFLPTGVIYQPATSYQLDRSTDQSNWTLNVYNGAALTFADTGRTAGTLYYYRARGYDGVTYGAYATANATTDVASGSVWPTMSPSYTPIVRNMAGPGLDTPAGSGRNSTGTPAIYIVNTLSGGTTGGVSTVSASPLVYSGTLRDCIIHHNGRNAPSVIVFDRSGTIPLGNGLNITKPYLTIAGQTAPAPGIQLTGYEIGVMASHVLIQHITHRCTSTLGGSGDNIFIGSGAVVSHSVVVDHTTFGFGIDESFTLTSETNSSQDQITLSRSILHDPLRENYNPGIEVPKIFLQYPGVRTTTENPSRFMLYGCLMSSACLRIGATTSLTHNFFVNNLLYNPYSSIDAVGGNNPSEGFGMQWNLRISVGAQDRHVILGNIFRKGPNSGGNWSRQVNQYGASRSGNTQCYIGYNYGWNGASELTPANATQFSPLAGGAASGVTARQGSQSNLAWNPDAALRWFGYSDDSISGQRMSDLLNAATLHVGSRPGDTRRRLSNLHDTLTAKVVDDARSNYSSNPLSVGTTSNGANLNHTQANALRPTYADNPASWTLPANPHTVAGNGYTNLENWLHGYEDAVL